MNKIIKLLDHTFLLSKPPYTIVDLGCNKGNFYNACVKTLGEANIEKYIGVEPNEYLYKEHLSKLVSHNVIMLNAAVTGKTLEFVKLYIIDNDECSNIIGEGSFDWGQSPKETMVKNVTLPNLLCNISVVDYLKIDIEGSEYDLVHQLSEVAHKIKQLSIEFHDFVDVSLRNKTYETIREIEDLGFKMICNNRLDYLHGTNYADCLFVNTKKDI